MPLSREYCLKQASFWQMKAAITHKSIEVAQYYLIEHSYHDRAVLSDKLRRLMAASRMEHGTACDYLDMAGLLGVKEPE